MALDEATAALVADMAASGAPALHELEPAEARGLMADMKQMFGAGPQMLRAERREVCAAGREIPVHVLVPNENPRAVIVYLHGGGWVVGRIDEFETLGRELARATGCAVVLVDYRLAPEHPFPAALEDAWEATTWVAANLDGIAGADVPLILAGDSAGGNLAAVVCQRARRSGPAIAMQVLLYPVTDCDFDTPSYTSPENQLEPTRADMQWFFDHYAPPEIRRDPEVSPLRAEDLSGLPPTVVVTAGHDVLRDEGTAYARALQDAGVPVSHREFLDQMHGFFTMVNVLPGSVQAMDFVAEEIERHVFTQLPG
ncbi:alpha/beta hydrolase [Streptomyces carpinensis]|uniref:Alpha/beta hydrolase n=1 Tax=Streptomyces carpinensis TaxID=66369 RepID=A0ABV1VV70_9ACTN|nr:alpha/beta hydrolase [Streptomyces carpinensis]